MGIVLRTEAPFKIAPLSCKKDGYGLQMMMMVMVMMMVMMM